LIVQFVLIVLLLGVVIWMVRINTITSLEKRFKKFSLDPLENNEIAFFDKIKNYYLKQKRNLSNILIKSYFFKDYSKKYEKYIDRSRVISEKAIDYISSKFICSFAGVILIIVSDVLRYKPITIFQITLVFLIFFFIPDLYWMSREKIKKRRIEKDMLKAIIIMNNSFKSGLSIMQAIYMVSNELEGPIADEFHKMYIDISFGLDMDLVFERFANRINNEEAHYISTSLSVLNKTGGNIVHVFASVERSAFTRKKLKDELEALTASAKAIYKLLIAIPIFMAFVIIISNSAYFLPLITTEVGRIVLILILAIYIAYVIIVSKIVNIKE